MYWTAWASVDFFAFVVLQVASMGYDDNYDSSKGEYGSLASMNTAEKIIYFSFILWIGFNAGLILYIGFKIYKAVRKKPSTISLRLTPVPTGEQMNL